jgi:hypothetical protein
MLVIIKPLKYFAMKKNRFLIMSFIGLIGLLISCEKDETKVVMLKDPVAPKFVTFPDLTLEKVSAKDTLRFIGTLVDLGFTASADYILEACVSGTGFLSGAGTIRIYIGKQDTLILLTEEAVNKILVKKFPAGVAAAVDFRIRAQMKLDSGTGALGSNSKPMEYISEIKTVNVITY